MKPWIFRELASGSDELPSTDERLAIYLQLGRNLLDMCGGADDRGVRKAMRFLPWHLGWFGRYRPYAGARYAAAATDAPLIQTRDVREYGRDGGCDLAAKAASVPHAFARTHAAPPPPPASPSTAAHVAPLCQFEAESLEADPVCQLLARARDEALAQRAAESLLAVAREAGPCAAEGVGMSVVVGNDAVGELHERWTAQWRSLAAGS